MTRLCWRGVLCESNIQAGTYMSFYIYCDLYIHHCEARFWVELLYNYQYCYMIRHFHVEGWSYVKVKFRLDLMSSIQRAILYQSLWGQVWVGFSYYYQYLLYDAPEYMLIYFEELKNLHNHNTQRAASGGYTLPKINNDSGKRTFCYSGAQS